MDPVQQMKVEEKRRLVEADKRHEKAKDKLDRVVEEKVPDAAKGGQMLELVLSPNPLLKRVCEPVPGEGFDHDLKNLVTNMAYTMYLCGGVGLSAPQVGKLQRVFVADWSKEGTNLVTVVNPEIVEVSPKNVRMREGCLSFPSVRVVAARPAAVCVTFWTERKEKVEKVWLEGWAARVFLHEYDHLNGVVFLDQVSGLERRMAMKKAVKFRRSVDQDMAGKRRQYQRRGWR